MGRTIATGLVACMLLASANARAFCRTTTEPPRPTAEIPSGSECAPRGGLPLFHRSRCFAYQLTAERPELPNAVFSEQVARAFAAWTIPNAICTPGITVLELPADTSVIFGRGDVAPTPRNRIGWMTLWNDGPQGEDWFARTYVTFSAETGEILDADIAITPRFSLGQGNDVEVLAELQSLLVHEVGHLFGFSHSSRPTSVLYEGAAVKPSLTSISADDGAGMCMVYPSRTERLAGTGLVPSEACQLTQSPPSRACGEPELVHGCSSAPLSARGPGGSRLSLVALAAALAAARRLWKGLVWWRPSWCRHRRGFRSCSDPPCGSRDG